MVISVVFSVIFTVYFLVFFVQFMEFLTADLRAAQKVCSCAYTVSQKRPPFYFWNNSVKNKAISIISGTQTPEET